MQVSSDFRIKFKGTDSHESAPLPWLIITFRLSVDIGVCGVLLDEFTARTHFLAHKDGECMVGAGCIGQCDALQHSVFRIHCGFPKLLGIHLTETFITLQYELVAVAATVSVYECLHLLVVPGIFHYAFLSLY